LAWIQVVVGELYQASGAGQSNSMFDKDIRRYLYDDDNDMLMIKLIFLSFASSKLLIRPDVRSYRSFAGLYLPSLPSLPSVLAGSAHHSTRP
jgi:hypothetical protein